MLRLPLEAPPCLHNRRVSNRPVNGWQTRSQHVSGQSHQAEESSARCRESLVGGTGEGGTCGLGARGDGTGGSDGGVGVDGRRLVGQCCRGGGSSWGRGDGDGDRASTGAARDGQGGSRFDRAGGVSNDHGSASWAVGGVGSHHGGCVDRAVGVDGTIGSSGHTSDERSGHGSESETHLN